MDWSPRRPFRARRHGAALLCGALLLAVAPGCGRRAAEKAARPESSASQPEWAWLQRTKADLDARRARLAAQPDPRLQKETQALADELNRRLAAFLNETFKE